MATVLPTGRFDFSEMKRALEHSDAQALASLYADDAEMTIVDRDRPPSAPMKLTGKTAIQQFWTDICGRDMTHAIGHEVVGSDRVAFVEECQYPDGCHVVASTTLDLRDGRIARHLAVQAWDDTGAG
ncbi:MAG TPA: nuclear transport factor 2 family protein [Azospirillaceae bacterium]|nr:nuclear transport factor 2 family protein [Azospirillaceae bacterium]